MRHSFIPAFAMLALTPSGVAFAQAGAAPHVAAAPPAAATAPAAPAAATTPSAPQAGASRELSVTRLPIAGVGIQAARVSGEFNASFEVVSRVVLDFSTYHEFLPQVRESRVVQRRRAQQDVYLAVPLMDGLPGIWALDRFDIQRTPTSVIVDGHMVNGNMTRADVRIEAQAIAGTQRTVVSLQVLGIPSFPLPSGYLNMQQGRWGTRGMTALRDRAEHIAGLATIAPASPSAPARTPPAATTQRPGSGGGPPPAHD